MAIQNKQNKDTPLLSIVTINRNNATGLRKTIKSVVTQTAADFEYIIIDGASTDESVAVIKEYAEHPIYGKKISYWISEPDTGIYNAMNKGLRKARGSLTALVNSGDWYLPNALSMIYELHKNNPDSILYGALKAYENGKFQSVWGTSADFLPKEMIPHLSTFVPKNIYEKYGYYDESYKIAGDYDAFLRFYTQNVDFQFIDKIICNFNLEGISQTDSLVRYETAQIQKKYGFYVCPTFKQKTFFAGNLCTIK